MEIENNQVTCAISTIPQDLSVYLSDSDLTGILTPTQEKISNKNKDEYIKDYTKLYELNRKQMILFLEEFKISQKKTEIIKGINTCIDTYNNINFN